MSSYTNPDGTFSFVCDGCGETVDLSCDDVPDGWIPILIGDDGCDACGPYCAWQILGVFRDDLALEIVQNDPEWDPDEDACFVRPLRWVDVPTGGRL